MAITRSQIARQLLAEGGVSLDDAKRMAPEGEFLAYINPKEAQMLKDAGGSGIMTPMGIPSFVSFSDSSRGQTAADTFGAAASGGATNPGGFGNNGGSDGGGGPPPSTGGGSGPIKAQPTYKPTFNVPNYGKNISDFERYMATLGTGIVSMSPLASFGVNKSLKEEQEKQKDLMNAIMSGQQFFGTTPKSLTTQYQKTTGMDTGPKGPPSGGDGGELPIIPKISPQVAKLPTDIEPDKSDISDLEEFQQRFILPERFRLADGGDVKRRKKGEPKDDDGEEPGPKSFPRLREGEIFLDKMPRPRKREILEAAEGGQVTVKDAEKMAPKGEFLAYINDDEAALLKSLGGAGQAVNETGIPSFFVKKLFKKATKAVKKVVKSPIGKAALAGAAIYGLGGGFGLKPGGFAFSNLPGAGFFTAAGNPAAQKAKGSLFSRLIGKIPGAISKIPGGGVTAGILGASALGGLAAGAGGEDDETIDDVVGRISSETGLDVQQIRKEVQDAYAKGDISSLASKYPFLVPTGSAMAEGGIARLGYAEGSDNPQGRKGFKEIDPLKPSLDEIKGGAGAIGGLGKVGKKVVSAASKKLKDLEKKASGPKQTISDIRKYIREAMKTKKGAKKLMKDAELGELLEEPISLGDMQNILRNYFKSELRGGTADGGIARLGYADGETVLDISDVNLDSKMKAARKLSEETGMPIEKALEKIMADAFAEGVSIKRIKEEMMLPKRKPPEEVQKRREQNFEKAKPGLEKESADMVEDLIRSKKAGGGLMDLGGNEMDLRGGGFVPIGAKEKADDVPARLSKNEFVFTADAVRAAGGGSVEKGAQKMYNTMKQLEDSIA